ncbi:hypothetical protein [Paenibacillus agilis]|uniref:Uncharacterized protein n=1 Tax=Paenibacillus agilis TaxID=3020863 RepID=A0A559IX32_9BACL|nr:hypothetical protein [Paenibacillus agilis]TVX92192.1 hypothetical protein FPZ44_03440 [Paenibacillus agilis]
MQIVFEEIELHVTPLEEVKINTTEISIEFDDSDEVRWRATICPYQGFRVTTIDCIETELFMINGKRPFHILEVKESEWLNKLKLTLAEKDATADFLEKAHHYVFPFQDIIIEVVCWEPTIEKV